MRTLILVVTLTTTACSGEQAPFAPGNGAAWARPPRPEKPEIVAKKADIVRLDGQWAEVRGTVTRSSFVAPVPVRREGKVVAARDEGTALVLADGAELLVSRGPPPDGWEGLVGQRVSVVALVWNSSPREQPGGGESNQPSISSWETPVAVAP